MKQNNFSIKIIMTVLLSVVCFLGITMPKAYASSTTQTTIKNKIDESLADNKTYILNGFKYTYTSFTNRFTASPVDNPQSIKLIVFYEKINGKQAFYPSDLSLANYSAIEDVVVHSASNVKTYLAGKTIKNLYIASQNQIMTEFANFQVTNYHFVSLYKGLYTDITYMGTTNFNNMTITNAYYYDWNKIFFKNLADKYHASSGAVHNFQLKSDDECTYTKESFYPFEGFQPTLEKCGVKYYHGTNSSILPDVPTNDNFPYVAYEIDSRVKSITAPLVSSTALLSDITFDTLDIRGYSIGSMSTLKGNTIIVTNSMSSFNTTYFNFKNIYFVYDPNGSTISSVSSGGTAVEKIYIPNAHKEQFSAITSNSSLESKIFFYTENIKTDFIFTNTAKTKTYKSSDDSISISTTLISIQSLEAIGVTIPDNVYINVFLENFSLPTTEIEENEETATKYDLARLFVFTKNIDIPKAIAELKPYMLYKDGKPSSQDYTLTWKIQDNNILELTGKFPDNKEFIYTIEYKVITSAVGEFAGCDRFGDGDFTILVEAKTIKEGINASDLIAIYLNEARIFAGIAPVFKLPITMTKEGISARESVKYKNNEDIEVTAYGQVVVTKKDINPEGFQNPFYTTKDEYGETSILEKFMDKIDGNPTLKWVSVGTSALFGILFIYIIFVLCKKSWKWLKQ